MTTLASELHSVVLERLTAAGLAVESIGGHPMVAELAPRCIAIRGLSTAPEEIVPRSWPPPAMMRFNSPIPISMSCGWGNDAFPEPFVQEFRCREFRLSARVAVRDYYRYIGYCLVDKWRAHPPSKRKRMRSWQHAHPVEKMAYAPIRGRYKRLPRRFEHPHKWLTQSLGEVIVSQSVFVFSDLPAADIEAAIDSDGWRSKVMAALRVEGDPQL